MSQVLISSTACSPFSVPYTLVIQQIDIPVIMPQYPSLNNTAEKNAVDNHGKLRVQNFINTCAVKMEEEADDSIDNNFMYNYVIDKHDDSTMTEFLPSKPKKMKMKELKLWSKTLPAKIQIMLVYVTGKHNVHIQFDNELMLHHVLLVLLTDGYLNKTELEALDKVTPLVVVFLNPMKEYGDINTAKTRGFDMYKNFHNETDFNKDRICLSTKALLHSGFDAKTLVHYIGGTHAGAHQDIN